ncbi:GTPase activating protein [Purpureocillium lavendulum]|uniref:GTPase activating protein n=1 Tax=Purpureocillium lavendulum TaxID=1247861 RepID=A0AB34FJJ6_9HYPO|nr:GTPase activating protein [Purpureocillium lavendulum]
MFCRDNLHTFLAHEGFTQCFWDGTAQATYSFSMARNYTFFFCGSESLTVPAIPGGNTADTEMQDLLINQCRYYFLKAWIECPYVDATGRERPGIGGNWTVGCVDYDLKIEGH